MTRLQGIIVLAAGAAATAALLSGCQKAEAPPVYEAVPVAKRDIVVSAQAAGTVQPDTTIEVKSKASGEILEMKVDTGDSVSMGDLMVRIDPRTARNQVRQAQADLDVAHARLANAESQRKRAEELYKSQAITETEYEQAILDYANAKASVVNAEVALENAQIELDDTDVRAPISGTVIEKDVERGQVISSPSRDVGGGTVLLLMADLNSLQVKTLVDETDIGKIQPGMPATITVDAYPNQPFDGEVLKIEPQAVTQQNVTMFPVQVRIQNRGGLLRPGMNAEVEIHIGRRDGVLAVPNAALRTQRDAGSAAQVLGLDPATVEEELAAAANPPGETKAEGGGPGPAEAAAAEPANTFTTPDGRTITLPAGVTADDVQKLFAKRRSGQELSETERSLMRSVFAGSGGPGAGGHGGGRPSQSGGNAFEFGGRYIVFVERGGKIVPTYVQTGLTDLDYSEVVSGLSAQDSVLILPSASLVQSQQEFKERVSRVTGGMGGMRQNNGSQGGGSR